MNEDNGILAKVLGPDISDALSLCPDPATTDADQVVEIEAQHIGRVRIYARRHKSSHGRSLRYFWMAYRAEEVTTL